MPHQPHYSKGVILLLVLVFSFTLWTCSSPTDPVDPGPKTTIEHGDYTNAGTLSIGSGGGSLTASGAVQGLTITVPPNSYADSRQFTVESAPVTSHTFGQYFQPLSPLIRISNGGGYSSEVLEVEIPVNIPSGHIPLAFYYDENNGKLESIPILNANAGSVTISTRHFSTSTLMKKGMLKTMGIAAGESFSQIIISSLAESAINGVPMISTGFTVGVDDWEFVNYGSYISPGGHCAGQSIAAMWYWYEKKPLTGEKLFNRYSNNANMWEDNARGYRLSSVLQNDQLPQSLFTKFMRNTVRLDTNLDRLKFYTIAGAMLVTGEPIYVSIAFQDGVDTDNKPIYAGHALVCYGVSMSGKRLLISDPNTPANAQGIDLVNDVFVPYQSKLNGKATSKLFPYVAPLAKTSMLDWEKIGTRFGELEKGTIGTVAPHTFPAYTIWIKGVADEVLTDGYTNNDDSLLNIFTECPTAAWGWAVDGKNRVITSIFDESGVAIEKDKGSGLYEVILKPGANTLGFLVQGNTGATVAELEVNYIDFQWITINYRNYPFKIVPANMNGDQDTEYTWNITTDSFPKDLKYYLKWNFGDGSPEVRADNINYAKHTYTAAGTYTVRATLYDATSNVKLAKDSSVAEIAGGASIYPKAGPNGQVIVITGSGFGDVQRDGDNVTLHHPDDIDNHTYRAIYSRSWSDTRIEAVVDNASWSQVFGSYKIKVRLYNSSTLSYTWLGPWNFELVKCEFTSITPDTVRENTLMTINGRGFGVKMPGDAIRFNDSLVHQITSWSDTKIECVVPDYYDGPAQIYLFKAGVDNYRYDAPTKPYWRTLPSGIVKLLVRATEQNYGRILCDADYTLTTYDVNGKVLGTTDGSTTFEQYLSTQNASNVTFKITGRTFQSSFDYPVANGDHVECSGTISADGQTLETVTVSRTHPNGKIQQRISFANVPLATYNRYSSDFSWVYSATSNASSYITDLYMANYYTDGKLQSDFKLKNGKKVEFQLQCKYK